MKKYCENVNGEEFTVNEYKKFMYDESNAYCCESCPENKGFDNGNPCGQQNCWVCVHCRR